METILPGFVPPGAGPPPSGPTPPSQPPSPPTSAMEARFWEFHAENPHVFEGLARFAMEAKRAGRKRLSIEVLYGRLRWYSQVETTGDPYKLNDHYTAFYSRLLMQVYPELQGMFELRRSYADDAIKPPV